MRNAREVELAAREAGQRCEEEKKAEEERRANEKKAEEERREREKKAVVARKQVVTNLCVCVREREPYGRRNREAEERRESRLSRT